jgi:hypothetical protein
MPAVVRPARPHYVFLGVVLTLLGVLMDGCARLPANDPRKAELLRQIREAYLFDVDVASLELLSVPEIVARLIDTRLVEVRRRMSPDFIRGFSRKVQSWLCELWVVAVAISGSPFRAPDAEGRAAGAQRFLSTTLCSDHRFA